jgi:hypothetical protein
MSAYTPQVAVIGMGPAGMNTALMLARQGIPVAVLEKEEHPLNDESGFSTQQHLGAEYLLHRPTALNCARYGTVSNLILGTAFYTPNPPKRWVLSKKMQDEGKITFGEWRNEYDHVLRYYSSFFERCHDRLKENAHEHEKGKRWTKYDTAKQLHGLPERFYKLMDDRELDEFNDSQGNRTVVGGFHSQERGLDIPLLNATLEAELERQVKAGYITPFFKCRVKKDGAEALAEGPQRIHYTDRNGRDAFLDAPVVVQTAAEGGPEITPLEPNKRMHVYNRAMILGDARGIARPLVSVCKIGDTDGATLHMLKSRQGNTPYNGYFQEYVVGEEGAYRLGDVTLTNEIRSIPEHWNRKPETPGEKKEYDQWMHHYHRLVVKSLPALEGSRPVSLLLGRTISFQDRLEERLYEQPKEIRPGYIVAYLTKRTYAEAEALQIVDMVKRRLRNLQVLPLLEPNSAFDLALKSFDEPFLLKNIPLVDGPDWGEKYAQRHPGLLHPSHMQPEELRKEGSSQHARRRNPLDHAQRDKRFPQGR